MKIAIQEAKKCLSLGEVPIGAVIINKNGKIISKAGNRIESEKDPTAISMTPAFGASLHAGHQVHGFHFFRGMLAYPVTTSLPNGANKALLFLKTSPPTTSRQTSIADHS